MSSITGVTVGQVLLTLPGHLDSLRIWVGFALLKL